MAEHFLGFEQQGGFLFGFLLAPSGCHQPIDLLLVGLVELHVVLPHELVALEAGAARGLAVTELLPSHHAFADVDTAIVDHLHLDDLVAGCLKNAAHAPPEEDVAQVAKVQRLVGVG